MRLLSVRLIVSLIVGITLVSLGFSYYEVLREKRVLRSQLERNSEELGESFALNRGEVMGVGLGRYKERCSVLGLANTCLDLPFTICKVSCLRSRLN